MAKLDREVKGTAGAASLWIAVALLAAAGGCDRRSELLGVRTDGTDADGQAPIPPRFAPPTLVPALSDPAAIDEDPTFTGDLLELYFMSTRAGTRDLFSSRRASADEPWGSPTRVEELSSSDADWAASVSLDGLRIWFASDRGNVGQAQIWHASRMSRSAPWTPPARVGELASGSIDFAPAVDATETLLFFASDRADPGGDTGGAGFDLYATGRAGPALPWGPPAAIAGANGASDEYDPFVAQGGLVIFFTSMRSGMGDLYWSARRSVAEPFPAPVRLDDVSSDQYDSDATLSVDLGYLMFSSTRSGNAEIYETRAVR